MLKPHMLRVFDTWGIAIFSGFVILVLTYQHSSSQIAAGVGLIVGLWTIWSAALLHVRIIVTDDRVISQDASIKGWRRSVPRAEVAYIRRYSYWTVFGNANEQVVLRTRGYWTHHQLVQLAQHLRVPLWERHQGWKGLFFDSPKPRLVPETWPPPREDRKIR